MTNKDVHDELSLLGVSAEVHALVDDLDLTVREPPLGELLCYPSRIIKKPFEFHKHVYQPHTVVKEETGWFDFGDGSSLREVCRMPCKKSVGVRRPLRLGGRKSR